MTQRVRGILVQRWSDAGEPTDGWVIPAQNAAAGNVVPNTIYYPHDEGADAIKNLESSETKTKQRRNRAIANSKPKLLVVTTKQKS
jgi:hypothetical protein